MQTEPLRVLAVLVLYRRLPEEAAAWRFLCEALQAQVGGFGLTHCLVYDNSPLGVLDAALPEGFSYHSNPANGGTAAAYRMALDRASELGCKWLLLLDQDTLLPTGYLDQAAINLEAQQSLAPAVLIPQIVHQGDAISPAVISRFGSITPVRSDTPATGIVTAISSGLVIRADALGAHLPKDPVFWLDYLDHMIFLGLSRSGMRLGYMEQQIDHHLSVQDPAGLSAIRLASILSAERAFCQALGPTARAMLPFRRLRRAMFYLRRNPALVLTLLRSVFS